MCRLAAFPAGTTKERAHEIVSNFISGNHDGVGSAHVKSGEFIVKKYPYSYQEAVTKKDDLFEHMPYDGWTIAHVRYATHGENTIPNTHPIIRGDIVGVHNGVFGASSIIRVAMADSVKWAGETDSEVALYMLNKLGSYKFYKEMPSGAGVYLALNRNGELDCIKCSGDMKLLRVDGGKWIVASHFAYKEDDIWTELGCYGFKADGTPRDWQPKEKKKEETRTSYTPQDIWRGGRHYCGDGDYDLQEGRATDTSTTKANCPSGYVPPTTHIPTGRGSLVVVKDGVIRKIEETEKPKPPSLWNWRTESEIMDYIRAMA